MSGSIAAIAAYDGSGTQGYGTTDKTSSGVKSVFWNESDTDKYYVNGCSFSEVSSNKGEITTPETVVFTFDNDTDAINDLTLAIERTGEFTLGAGTPVYYMLYFIERIEICVGNQIICSQNTMQLIKDYFDNGDYSFFTDFYPTAGSTTSTQTSAQKVKLNIFRMLSNNGLDSSYLMACANNQTLQLKIYPQNFTLSEFSAYVNSTVTTSEPLAFTNNKFIFKLFANKTSMTNDERDYLRNQLVPKRTNVSQFAQLSNKPTQNLAVGDTITISCDHFNIYAKSLYILGVAHKGLAALGGFGVELYLNSTSYCGEMPYYITNSQPNVRSMSSLLNSDAIVATASNAAAAATAVDAVNTRIHEANTDRFFYYKIDLANNSNNKYDQNYVPLSRFDSIRVILTAQKDITQAHFDDFFETLTVVAEGKCTALYQNGAVTFNNY